MQENYRITSVSFSSYTKIENSSAMEFTDKVGVPHDEVSYVKAHISFDYVLGGVEKAGMCETDVAKIGTTTFDLVDGVLKATAYTPGDEIPDMETLMGEFDSAVATEYQALVIKELQEGVGRKYLGEIIHEYAYDNRLSTPASPSYDELSDFNTGIGTNKLNILEL